ncbi:MAG: response regulator [Magnetococcus sp. YQC-9]
MNSEGLKIAEPAWRRHALLLLAVPLSAAIFLFDLWQPLDSADGVLYLAVLIMGWWMTDRRGTLLYLAIGTSWLVLLDFWLSQLGDISFWLALINRAYVLFAIWSMAVTLWIAKGVLVTRDQQTIEMRKLSVAVEQSPAAVIVTNADGVVEFVNARFVALTGYSREESIGLTQGLERFGLREGVRDGERVGTPEHPWRGELANRKKNGEIYWCAVAMAAVRDRQGVIRHHIGVIEDITQRREQERRQSLAHRALRSRLRFAEILAVAEEEEARMLGQLCRVLVEEVGYRLAWVGMAQMEGERWVRPVASHGHDVEYLHELRITWSEGSYGNGPTGRAIRTGRPCVAHDLKLEKDFEPWLAQATQCGFQSSIALPLRVAGQVIGALNIYASYPDAFDEIEIDLLRELAGQMANAIRAMRERLEKRRLERAVQANERRYHALFNSLESGVVVYEAWEGGEDFIIREINPAGARITQVDPERVIGRRVTEVFPGVRTLGLFEVFQRVHQSGESAHLPVTYYQDETLRAWFENHVYRLESGEIVAVFNDRSEQKRAEEAKSQYAAIVAASRDHMSFVGHDYVYRAVNPAYLQAHGLQRHEIEGHSIADLLGEETFHRIRGLLDRCLQGETINYQAWFDFAVNGRCWMDVCYYPDLRPDGRVRGIVVVARDFTERKRMEDELRASEEQARLANRAKAAFLANMSHEIRTPMNAILGMGHLALQTQLTNQQQNYLKKMQAASESLLRIINDVLDFSKIDAGKMTLEMWPFDLCEVMERVTDGVLTKANANPRVEVLVSFPLELPRRLIGDAVRLGQVLTNLCDNAVKFTERGEVVLAVESVDVGDGWVSLAFEVRDTGIGIETREIERLLQPFQQADSSTTRRYGGTGLGLAICHTLVKMMGGTLTVNSRPGAGSRFSFEVRFQLAEKMDQKRFMPPADLEGRRVLVVDDNAVSRKILTGLLRGLRFVYEAVESGEAALVALRRAERRGEPVDLLLLDWAMPGMDGLETARRIMADPEIPLHRVIIMVSTFEREMVMATASDLGMCGFIHKPVTPSVLLDAIMERFGKAVTRAPAGSDLQEPCGIQGLCGKRILVVDDLEDNVELIRELLMKRGVEVVAACNGLQALEKVQESPDGYFDLVLMDMQMPVMDGWEAARRLGVRPESPPVIAMTASVLAEDVRACLDAGMRDHIAKPVVVKDLLQKLISWCCDGVEESAPELPASREMISAGPANGPLAGPVDGPSVGAEVQAIDWSAGLLRCEGDAGLQERLVVNFRKEFATALEPIAEELACEAWDGAMRRVHKLKGAAANIDATALTAVAGQMETALRRGEIATAQSHMPALREALRAVLSEIERSCEPEGKSTAQPEACTIEYVSRTTGKVSNKINERSVDKINLLQLLQELGILLDKGDMRCDVVFRHVEQDLLIFQEVDEDVNRLRGHLERLEMAQARQALDALIRHLEL